MGSVGMSRPSLDLGLCSVSQVIPRSHLNPPRPCVHPGLGEEVTIQGHVAWPQPQSPLSSTPAPGATLSSSQDSAQPCPAGGRVPGRPRGPWGSTVCWGTARRAWAGGLQRTLLATALLTHGDSPEPSDQGSELVLCRPRRTHRGYDHPRLTGGEQDCGEARPGPGSHSLAKPTSQTLEAALDTRCLLRAA